VVRIVLIPLTWRQLKSMRAMQALAPQIKELQEKYKDDRELLNRKTMEFYQENKVSPFGSCLPLLLQMPVFFGLYYMLNTAGHAGLDPAEAGRWAGVFVDPKVGWLWIADITKFDYLLMFVYMASQFVASWQTARKAGGQQKMIAYFMPVIVGIFMFIGKWPAGLFIYWVTSNVWTIAQQFFMEKVVPVPVAVTDRDTGKTAAGKPGTGKPGPGKALGAGKTAGGKSIPAKTSSGKAAPGKAAPGKTTPGKTPSKTVPTKAGPGGSAPSKGAPQSPGKAAPAKGAVPKSGPVPKGTPAKTTPAKADPSKAPAGKSGGKSSGEQIGKQGKAATGSSQRPDSGAGGTEGSG